MNELMGRVLAGRYRVDAFLGKGGMAEVYKVWDSKRSVHLALKLLHADLAEDKIFVRRFQREASTLSKLQHPNIVRFYGLEQDGRLVFILMDFVEGTTLRTEIFDASGPFSSERVLEVMRPVCAALHYAHQSGFVHCDVKPPNIMIDSKGSVLLSDFGIARMSEAATSTMIGVGTPAYMAPEQVRGEDPTPRTDVYSLGIVLYEMLTGGERPFTGEHAQITGTTAEKIRWEHVRVAPTSPRKFNRSLTPALEAVVMRCLQKAPAARYGGTLEVMAALELSISKRPTLPTQAAPAELQPVSADQASPPPGRAADLHPAGEPGPNPRPRLRVSRLALGLGVAVITLGLIGALVGGLGAPAGLAVRLTTPTGTLTPTGIQAPTLTPTSTPRPTSTPNLAATQAHEEFYARIKHYYANGYIPSLGGVYSTIPSLTDSDGSKNNLRWTLLGRVGPDFVTSAHIRWSSAADTGSVWCGCGFAFWVLPSQYLGVVLDRSRIAFLQSDMKDHYLHLVGTTRGTGRVSFGNPADANLTLIVHSHYAYVLVDDKLIGEYTLSKDRASTGEFGYMIRSGTNEGYGTRCEITDWRLWEMEE